MVRIGVGAFAHCISLAAVTLPDGMTEIADNAFLESGLTSITVPRGIQRLGSGVFARCAKLTKAVISAELPEINSAGFYQCPLLAEVQLPDSAAVIKDRTHLLAGPTAA